MEKSVDRCQKVFFSDDFQKYFSKKATSIFLKQNFSENEPPAVKRLFSE